MTILPVHPWSADQSQTPAALESWVQGRLNRHQQALDSLLAEPGPRTLENTLRPFDDAVAELAATGSQIGLLNSFHPEKAIRDTAQDQAQLIAQAGVELSLNQKVYQALSEIAAETADLATRHYLDRALLQYRLAGVDKDDATRARLKELQDKATLLSLSFSRNVQEGGNTVTTSTAELDGLPPDFLGAHQPDANGSTAEGSTANGSITLTTDFPDYLPVMTFAKSHDLRRRMF